MNNYFVMERLGEEHMKEAMREADRARMARQARTSPEQDSLWSKVRGKVMPDAAGAREVPSL